MQCDVRVLSGELKGQILSVEGVLVIGRAPTSDLILQDALISRSHARLEPGTAGLEVVDLDSHNGTYLNGARITGRSKVGVGDIVRIGATQLLVVQSSRVRSAGASLEGAAVTPLATIDVSDLIHGGGTLRPRTWYGTASGVRDGRSGGDALDAARRDVEELALLHDVAWSTQRAEDTRALVVGAVERLLAGLGGTAGHVVLLDEHGEPDGGYVIRVGIGVTGESPRVSRTVAQLAVKDRRGLVSVATKEDARLAGATVDPGLVKSLLAFPLVAGDRPVGVVQLESGGPFGHYGHRHLEVASVAGSLVGVALANRRLMEEQERVLGELERSQARLLDTQDQLVRSEQLAAVGRLASGIGHEVRNHLIPLALVDELADRLGGDTDAQEVVSMVREAQDRVLALLDEIRQFARNSKQPLRTSPVGLASVVEGSIRFLRCDPRARVNPPQVVIAASPTVAGDGGRLRQVIINLVLNALDATRNNGGAITVTVDEDDAHAILRVRDRGTGVPPEVRERIFEPLFTTKGDSGTGLGLDICRQIVEAHTGTIALESPPDGGATFVVRLPRATA